MRGAICGSTEACCRRREDLRLEVCTAMGSKRGGRRKQSARTKRLWKSTIRGPANGRGEGPGQANNMEKQKRERPWGSGLDCRFGTGNVEDVGVEVGS
jgi:hypothetical protein